MDREYFQRYYNFEKNHWWFRARAEILRDYIKANIPGTSLSILNAGAATGGSIEWLSSLGQVTSLEYDPESVRFVREALGKDVIEGSVLSLPFETDRFDLVCAFDVIEHVEDDGLAVRELTRVCRKGGSVMVTVPAHMHLWSPHDEVNHHYRRYDASSLRQLFSGITGGSIEFTSYFNAYLYVPITLARKMNSAVAGLRKGRKPVSDFEAFRPGLTNELLFKLMRKEKNRLIRRRPFKTGVSLLLHWKKHE